MQKPFNTLDLGQKVEFFVACQQLLLAHHADSPFIIRQNTLSQTVDTFKYYINKYQGYAYQDDNVCVLWNHVWIPNTPDIKEIIKAVAYQPPAHPFNGASIDFVVFRKLADCLTFIKNNDHPDIQKVLFFRDGKAKLHPKAELLRGLKV